MILYNEVLDLTYDEVREKFPKVESANALEKVICLENGNDITSFSNDSAIMIWFDLGTNKPMIIAERVRRKPFVKLQINRVLKQARREMQDYSVTVGISNNKKGYDILVMKRELRERVDENY